MISESMLAGWHVILLHTHQTPELRNSLEALGAHVEILSTIAIIPLKISKSQLTHWQTLLQNTSILFITSQNAVHSAPSALLQAMAAQQKLKIITMGKATTAAAEQKGLTVFFTPLSGTTSESLLAEPFLQEGVVKGKTATLLAGMDGRQVLANTLLERNMIVHWMKVYRQMTPDIQLLPFIKKWRQAENICFIATSVHALENLHALTPAEHRPWLQTKPCIVISERIAKAALEMGFKQVFISNGLDAQALSEVLAKLPLR